VRMNQSFENAGFTFLIGFLAGVSPFLFMQLLPAMLSPSQALPFRNYVAILVTGILIGAITAVLFSKTFNERDPRDVFLTALGIPAILIATVSNISTRSEALHTVNQASAAASNAVLNPPPAAEPVSLEVVAPQQPKPQGRRLVSPAWAEQSSGSGGILLAQAGAYFVVIGKYEGEREAWQALEQLRQDRLRTELYFPKSLRVLRAGTGAYYVSYSGPLSQEEAGKLFKLIRINDPNLTPELLKQK